MAEWILKKYDGVSPHLVPPEDRRALERVQKARDRQSAAIGAGHPEWAELPTDAQFARRYRISHWFSGEACSKGHVAPRTWIGECQACLDAPSPEEERWLHNFSSLADRMIETGRLHYFSGGAVKSHVQLGRVVATSVKVKWPNVREACEKAARLTARDGRLRCVVNGATRMVVKLVAR